MRRRFLTNQNLYETKYFTIKALDENNAYYFAFNPDIPLEYHRIEYDINNSGEWSVIDINQPTNNGDNILTIGYSNNNIEDGTPRIKKNDIISLRINMPSFENETRFMTIDSDSYFSVYGNIMSLLYGSDFIGKYDLSEKNIKFEYLFCRLILDASKLILPATKLSEHCYCNMFYESDLLTKAPELLPATTLSEGCYKEMFYNCTSLTTAPELPATTLAEYCYNHMFYNCTSLTTVQDELPATTLANGCYYYMFHGCTSLTTAPELPATTLAEYCYSDMFSNCNKLNYIKMLAIDISASSCLLYWVLGVASTGTFVKNINMTSLPSGTSGIPDGWTVLSDHASHI